MSLRLYRTSSSSGLVQLMWQDELTGCSPFLLPVVVLDRTYAWFNLTFHHVLGNPRDKSDPLGAGSRKLFEAALSRGVGVGQIKNNSSPHLRFCEVRVRDISRAVCTMAGCGP